jgi:predicted transglutaminase-like cysteine proteinase
MQPKAGQIISAATFAACLLFAACPADAQAYASLPQAASPASTEGEARPIPAWDAFCSGNPLECSVDLGEPTEIPLTRQIWQRIVSVNSRVNATVRPLADDDHWGVPDRWDYPTDGFGDCEDYQLLKRRLLIEAGIPRRALLMTVVIDEKGEGHAVLMVRTDRGDFILDNKTQKVLPWDRTGYVFVKREGQHGHGWTSFGESSAPTTTANR